MSDRTPAEQRAIANNPDLPEDVAAAFAEDLNELADASGEPSLAAPKAGK